MSTANRNIGFKLVALLLVVTIFATLLPSKLVTRVYAAESTSDSQFLLDFEYPLADITETDVFATEPNISDRSIVFDEYEQIALEQLEKPTTVEEIAPYRRSDVKYEIPDMANAFTRNYALENGNYTRLIFGSPVNYKTNEGQWRKINLSLNEEENSFRPVDTPYDLTFASYTAESESLLSLSFKGISLDLIPLGIVSNSDKAKYESATHLDDELLTKNPCESGSIVYSDIFCKTEGSPSASIEYILEPYRVKENIIVVEGGFEEYSYSFRILTDAYSVELKDNTILVSDESGTVVFGLSASIMTDFKGNVSDEILLSMKQDETGYVVTVSANAEWINAPEREFPVAIDPTINIAYPDDDYAYEAVFVGTNTTGYGIRTGSGMTTYILLDSDLLTGLPQGATITHADVNFSASSILSLSGCDVAVRAERISNSWSPESVYNGGSLPSVPASYAGLTDSAKLSFTGFYPTEITAKTDITPVIRDIISGNSYGFALTTDCLSGNYPESVAMVMASVQITYTDNSGLNSYQSKHSISIDGSGTAYIKDVNGDLVYIHPGISSKGVILPVTIDMVYSSSFKGTTTDTYYGNGWRPSIIQTMLPETVTDIDGETYTFYVLTDGTGVKHYFVHSYGNVYEAEENQFQTYNTVTKKLEYGDGSFALFNSSGYLIKYQNAYGDSYQIGYEGTTPKITGVSDGSGVSITFMYYQYLLAAMVNISCVSRIVSFSYTGNDLTVISTPAGERTAFVYNTNGNITRFGYRESGSYDREYISFTRGTVQQNGVSPVNSITRFTLNDNNSYNTCEIVNLSFSDHTKYDYYYNSIIYGSVYSEYLFFDRSGRTTAVFDSLGNASGSEYAGGDLSKMNLVSGRTSSVMSNGNLVKDFTGLTDAWTVYPSANSGTLSAEDNGSHFALIHYGGEYFKLSTADSVTELYARYPVPAAAPGKTYTLSVDIDASGLSGTGGIVLGAIYTFTGMNDQALSPIMKLDLGVEQRAQYSFSIPSFAVAGSVSILIGFKNMSGNLYFDLVSLTEGACDRPVNHISDNGFYYGTSAWSVDGSFTPTVVTTDRIRCVQVPGSINETRRVSQTLSAMVYEENYLVVSGYGKGKAVSSGKFGIIVDFGNANLTDRELLFSNTTTEWQYVTAIIPISVGLSTVTIRLANDYNYTDVCFGGVTVEYVNGLGEYVNRSIYVYDEYGQITLEKSFSGEKTSYTYDETVHNRLSSKIYTDVRNNETTTTYSYNASLLYEVTSITESIRISNNTQPSIQTVTNYSYNSNGNQTESVTLFTHTSPATEVAHRLNIYSADGRFLIKETDASGRFITYNYSSSTGDLLSVTDGDGNDTTYTYDSYGRLTGETSSGSSIGITYGQNSTDISRSTFSYSIEKNAAGDRTGVKILDANGDLYRTLATYTYGGRFGQISKQTFGNGQEKYYGYDTHGYLTYIAFSPNANIGTATFAWYYDQNGRVIKTVDRSDPSNTVTKEYGYDQEGNISQVLSSDGNSVFYRYSTTFDQRYEHFITAGEGHEYNTVVKTIESQREFIAEGYLGTRTIVYDELGRISSFSNHVNISTLSKSYSYINKNETVTNGNQSYTLNNHTSLVSSETCSVSGVPTLSYTYYDNGKIKTISENGVQTHKYEYDSLGQLLREDNKKLNGGTGYTIRYTYDNCGNIICRAVYNYSPNITTENLAANATLIALPIWGYDSTYKDIMTSYVGMNVYSYDSAGNPLTYFGRNAYTMTWTRGNKLATVTPQGSTYAQSYLYDSDGLRTRKTLVSNSNVSRQINYFWVGNTLRSEWAEDGSYEIVYVYDASGRICGFSLSQNGGSGELYDYVRNAQGDVTHIVNKYGAIVAAYTYDTWGKLESIKNGSGVDITNNTSSIGYINPIRYRGYYYDNETGFYYLQSRYYDPATGRFLNADYRLNIEDGSLGTNLYCYCGNDPISGYDPEGTWDWGKFVNGLIMVGTAAVCIASVALSVASCGTLTPLMTVVAGVTVAAAVAYAFEGVSEIVEAGTGYNYIRETIFNGNEEAYEASKVVLSGIMQIGTAVMGMGACFIAGTLVATEAGLDAIENIAAGDSVYAYDEESGDVALKQVVRTFEREADELVHVTVNGEEIVCTNEHPFYSPIKGWTAACKLRAGDILVTVNGEYVVVEKIQHEILESPIKVYNFEVEDFHTYFVGDSEILVHNSCNHGSEWAAERRAHWRSEGLKYENSIDPKKLSDSGQYYLSENNIDLMLKGRAPIGIDGHKVQLHHVYGILNDFYAYIEITFTEHFVNFVKLHPWLF